ncbi:MAG: hypothetical protein U9N83_13740 [Thermodesulfobacteriota bacterium]|nr:hypothetical protein [Thermodesulfobacteriota bacterium]
MASGSGFFADTLIESSLDQELSVVRCQFWVERWRAAELCLTHGEFIDIGFFGYFRVELGGRPPRAPTDPYERN